MKEIEIQIPESTDNTMYTMIFQPKLYEKIRWCHKQVMSHERGKLSGEEIQSQKDDKFILRFSSRIWIPNITELKN